MPGIEDLMNIRTQGGTENAPMGMPPGMPPQGGAPMGMPPQGGAPMPPPPPQMAGMPPEMGGMSPDMGGMPPEMGGMPPEMGEQAPVNVEEDAVSLAEAVIERANGDPQAAVAILDTAANMILQSTQQEPMMANMGGAMYPQQMNMGGAMYPQQMNMGGKIYPQYANEGKYLEDETDTLRQMLTESMVEDKSAEVQAMRDFVNSMQEGRTMSDEDNKRFRDYQPEYEGLPENYQGNKGLMGKIRSLIPDAFQISEYLSDKTGRFPSVSDLDADELRQSMENRQIEEDMDEILAQRREEMLLERALADPDANDPEQVQMRERARTQAAERARAYRSR
jgi:hypothetical protein|tara:strand:- start:583 stop:1590 length:1008 start_codon:yes stop_codon:yes gene_type:complete